MISVCIATFNGEKYILEQLQSILSQLNEEDEIIISDDKSTDETRNIIESIGDNRIKLFINNNPNGYTSNFENSLKRARGEFIFLSDQDDVWKKNKVQIVLKYLKEYDLVVSDAIIVDESLQVLQESRNSILNIKTGLYNNLFKSYYLGCCMAFRKSLLERALPFPENHDLCLHDSWLTVVAESFFKTYICSEGLILYRRHQGNVSNGGLEHKWKIFHSIKIRMYLIFNLVKRAFKKK